MNVGQAPDGISLHESHFWSLSTIYFSSENIFQPDISNNNNKNVNNNNINDNISNNNSNNNNNVDENDKIKKKKKKSWNETKYNGKNRFFNLKLIKKKEFNLHFKEYIEIFSKSA